MILVDLDGTLINSKRFVRESYVKAFKEVLNWREEDGCQVFEKWIWNKRWDSKALSSNLMDVTVDQLDHVHRVKQGIFLRTFDPLVTDVNERLISILTTCESASMILYSSGSVQMTDFKSRHFERLTGIYIPSFFKNNVIPDVRKSDIFWKRFPTSIVFDDDPAALETARMFGKHYTVLVEDFS